MVQMKNFSNGIVHKSCTISQSPVNLFGNHQFSGKIPIKTHYFYAIFSTEICNSSLSGHTSFNFNMPLKDSKEI